MARSELALDTRTAPLALDLWTTRPLAVAPGLAQWLAEPGLLTARLTGATGGEVRLKVVQQELATFSAEQRSLLGSSGDTGYSREIELCIGRVPWVYAQTLVPDATLRACPWLAELGDSPLGEMLGALSGVSRGAFEYADLSAAHPLAARAQRAVPGESRLTLPARRALVRVRDWPLLVQEVFLPPLLAHAVA